MSDPSSFGDLQQLPAKGPLFASIKPKMMTALVEEVRCRTARAGEVLVRQGDFTEDLLLVLEGIATAYRTEPDGKTVNFGSYGRNDWFSEMTALSNQPE